MVSLDNIQGFILNMPNTSLKKEENESSWLSIFSLPFNFIMSRRHWISIIKNQEDGQFYNLDSKLSSPQLIGDSTRLIDFLLSRVNEGCELFIVIPKNQTPEDQVLTEKSE